MTVDSQVLSIGAVSDATGVAVTAIRYYCELDLIQVAYREGGQRRFDSSVIGKLNFIKAAQNFGFSLEQIRIILEDSSNDWREFVKSKIDELKVQQGQIVWMISILEELERCGCQAIDSCPRLDLPE